MSSRQKWGAAALIGLGVAMIGISAIAAYRFRPRSSLPKGWSDLPPLAKTAAPRERLSHSAHWALTKGFVSSPALDWGGGYGTDAEFFRSRGIDAYSYDPYLQPVLPPHRNFNFGSLSYVLDILPDRAARIAAVRKMASYLSPGARVVASGVSQTRLEEMAAQNPKAIKFIARDKIVSDLGVTFEAMTPEKLRDIFEAAGIEPVGHVEGPLDVIAYGRRR